MTGEKCSQCRKFKLTCIHGRPSWLKVGAHEKRHLLSVKADRTWVTQDQTRLRNFRDGVRTATTSHRKKARHGELVAYTRLSRRVLIYFFITSAKTPVRHTYPTVATGMKCTTIHAHDGLSSAWNTSSPMDSPKTRGEAPASCSYPTGDTSALGRAAGSSSSESDFHLQADLFGYEHLLFPIHDAPSLPPLPFTNMGIAKRETVGPPDIFEGTTSPVNTVSPTHGPPETFPDAQDFSANEALPDAPINNAQAAPTTRVDSGTHARHEVLHPLLNPVLNLLSGFLSVYHPTVRRVAFEVDEEDRVMFDAFRARLSSLNLSPLLVVALKEDRQAERGDPGQVQ